MSGLDACRSVELQVFDDNQQGVLIVGEQLKQVPFEIKRVYMITGLECPGIVRGQHAHKKLEQVIFCLRGSAELFLDDGISSKTIRLDRPYSGVHLAPGIWHEVRAFDGGALLLVLASAFHDENDYIRSRDEFLRFVHARANSF